MFLGAAAHLLQHKNINYTFFFQKQSSRFLHKIYSEAAAQIFSEAVAQSSQNTPFFLYKHNDYKHIEAEIS